MRRLAAEPWCKIAVAAMRHVAPTILGRTAPTLNRLCADDAIAATHFEASSAEFTLLDGRRCGNLVVCLEINDTLPGGLHSHLQDPELVAMKANEHISLGLQIVEPQFRRFAANSQIRNR